ncbi:helix-turn-helix transcriptional regulator [Streptomyces sp. NPDC055078]
MGKRASSRNAERARGDAGPVAGETEPGPGSGRSAVGRRTGDQGRTRTGTGAEAVHNRIAVLRAERAITRRQLADALGVHYQTVGYLERGEYSPSLYLALRIAEYFEVPVEVIFSTAPFPRIGSTPPA